MPRIHNCLWFDTQADEAAQFYIGVFPNSRITLVSHYGEAGPREAGMVLTVDFELDGTPFQGINGGPEFTFSEAVSFLIDCDTPAELDHYWEALTADGGQEGQCGWVKDRFGVSWQVVPTELLTYLTDPDAGRRDRATRAMLSMQKIDMAAIRAAVDQA